MATDPSPYSCLGFQSVQGAYQVSFAGPAAVRADDQEREERQQQALEELARQRAKDRLASWVRAAWPILNPGQDLVWEPWMDALCAHLEALSLGKKYRRLTINIPPGHSKTTICSICWPVWHWGKYGSRTRWLFASWSEPNVMRDQRARKDLLTSDLFQYVFEPTWCLHGSEAISLYETSEKGCFRCTTPKAKNLLGSHYDVIVLDDIVPATALAGPESDLVNNWWNQTVVTRVRNYRKVLIMYVGQRVSTNDLCQIWRKNKLDGCWLVLPAEYDPDNAEPPTQLGWKDYRKKAGELLSTRKPKEYLDELKITVGSAVYQAQQQQRPLAAGDIVFKPEWFVTWHRLPEGDLRWIGVFDMAAGLGGKDSDYSVGQVWAFSGAHAYLVDQIRTNQPYNEVLKLAKAFTDRHPKVSRWIVEAKSLGPALLADLKTCVRGVRGHETKDRKVERIVSLMPMAETGQIHLPIGEVGATFRDEAGAFSPKAGRRVGVHDDQLDAASLAIGAIRPNAAAIGPDEVGILGA